MTESTPGRGEQDWTDVETMAGGSERSPAAATAGQPGSWPAARWPAR